MKIGIFVLFAAAMFVGQTWRMDVESILRIDFLLHFVCYMLITILGIGINIKPNRPVAVCAAVWIFGFVMEIWQLYIGRDFGFDDLIANTIGIIVAFATQYFLKQ